MVAENKKEEKKTSKTGKIDLLIVNLSWMK
jgi:hypothetical protein